LLPSSSPPLFPTSLMFIMSAVLVTIRCMLCSVIKINIIVFAQLVNSMLLDCEHHDLKRSSGAYLNMTALTTEAEAFL